MSQVERVLKNLKQEIPPRMRMEYMPRDIALAYLKQVSGEDFGFDCEKWEAWVRDQEAAGVKLKFRDLT